MSTPLLSVVIPAYNVAPFLSDAVRSVLDQTLHDLEVIVVDDGSTDATPALLAAMTDPRLRVIRKPNGGLSSARNAGIQAARAPYLGLLDGDDVWMSTKAAEQVAILEADPSTTLTFSHSAYLNENGTPTGAHLICTLERPTLRQMILRNHVGNGSTPIGRTADFRAANLFDERFRTAVEDYEMWPRLMHTTGRGLRLVPKSLTGYRLRNTSGSHSLGGFIHQCRLARNLLHEKLPTIPLSLLDQGLAGSYRVAARKAASLGRRGEALRYLGQAIRLAPSLVFRDPRLLPTLALAMTAGRSERALYGALRFAAAAITRGR